MPLAHKPSDLSAYAGIDPGGSGAMAVLFGDRGRRVAVLGGDRPLADRWDWMKGSVAALPAGAFAVLERVGGYVGQAQPGSAAFKFGQSYGEWRGLLTAWGVPWEDVTPQLWQRAMGLTPRDNKGGETKTAFKNRLKAKAQQLFPDVKVTLATADALLLAEFCRRKRTGTL